MSGHLAKLVLMVALSHAYRVVGRRVGPRWAGLITALPCSTAIALVGSGADRGAGYAVRMADSCWVGLAGASAVPVAFAWAVVAGWGPFRTSLLAVSTYFAMLLGVGALAGPLGGNTAAAVACLATVTCCAIRLAEPAGPGRPGGPALRPGHIFWLRTAVPVICLAGVLGLGERLGPGAAGYLGTFPGVTLTALMLTRLETGPVAAVRMARALPLGNWAMVAFLGAFTRAVPTLGLAGGTTLGYASALICLGTVAYLTNPSPPARPRVPVADRGAGPGRAAVVPFAPGPAWPRHARRFSPLVEAIAA